MNDLKLTLRLTADGSGLKGELRKASGEVIQFGDSIEGGANRGTAALKKTEQQTDQLDQTTQKLTKRVKQLVVGYLSFQTAVQLGRMADQYTLLNAQIRLVTDSAGEQAMVFEEIEEIAGRTGQALDTVTRLTTRTIRALESSGRTASQAIQQGLELTNIISNAVLVSGAGPAEANAAIIQLSQGLASGVLRGEEFNSVMEQTPRIAQAIANALDMTLGQLRALAMEGGLTTDVVTDALLSQARVLEQEAASIPPTIARAWRALSNAVSIYVGEADEGIGASRTLAETMQATADNLDTVVDVAQVLIPLIGARLVVAVGASTTAHGLATAMVTRHKAALIGLAGLSNTAAAGQLALAAGSRAASGALALVGGPVGALAIGLTGLIVGVIKTRAALEETGYESEATREALSALQDIAADGWQPERIDEVRSAVSRLRLEIVEAEKQLRALRSQEAGRGSQIASQARSAAGMEVTAPDTAIGRAADRQQELVDRLREQVRLLEHLAGLEYHEDLANGMALMTAAGDAGIAMLERFGLVTRNAAGGLGEMAAASEEITGPLERQVQQLELQLITLRDGAAAAIDYQESLALAAAAQQDAEDVTTRNTEAVREHFAEVRRLTGEIDAVREARDRATAAERQAQTQREQNAAFKAQAAALEAEIRALSGGAEAWAEYQRQMFIAQQVASLGPDATEKQIKTIETLAGKLFELQDAMDGPQATETALDRILDRYNDFSFGSLVDEIRLVEQALEQANAGFGEFANPAGIAQLERALAGLRQEMLDGTIGAAQEGLRAIQSLSKNGSKEYAAMEVAIQALNVASAIGAVLNQGQGDPYTAPARMAAMATAVAGLVGSLNANFGGLGGNNDAANQQAIQGTGTVLGDADAKSESISRATDLTAKATQELVGINRGMLRALQTLSDGIAGASGMLARGAGQAEFRMPSVNENLFDNFGPLGSVLDFLDPLGILGAIGNWLGGSSKVTDQGIEILSGSIGELIEGTLVGAFADIRYKKWKFGKKRTRSEFQELDDAIAEQFGLIFDAITDAVLEGALALGLDQQEIQRAIDQFEVEAQRISLKDLSAEEQQAELEAVFSSIFDGLAGEVVPFIDQFQQVGEGLGETLIRVATGVQVTEEALDRLGFKLATDSPEQFAIASEGLIDLVGGIEAFIDQMGRFVNAFESDEVRFANAQDDLSRGLAQVGLQLPATRDGFLDLMQSLDASTEAGRAQIAMLLELTDAADEYYSQVEAIQSEREGLERQLLQLQGDTAALRALELATLDESNRALQQRIWFIQDQQAAEEEAARARQELADIMSGIDDEIASLSMSPLRNEFRDLTLSMRDTMAAIARLGGSEADFAQARESYALRFSALAESARAELISLTEQFNELRGGGQSGFSSSGVSQDGISFDEPVENFRDAILNALESIEDWLRDSELTNPSMTPRQRLNALRTEFFSLLETAQNGSEAEQAEALAELPDIASQLEALGVRVYGSATQPFQDLLSVIQNGLESVLDIDVPEARPDVPTSAQGAAIQSATEATGDNTFRLRQIAASIVEGLGVLSEITGQVPFDIANELGVPIGEIIETLIGGVEGMTIDTVDQLIAVANTLGVDLAEVADHIGFAIGQLTDQDSILSHALQDTVMGLPDGIQSELWPALNRVWQATTDADASAAIEELVTLTQGFPADVQNALAPFLEGVDPVDYLITQTGLLGEILLAQGAIVRAVNGVTGAILGAFEVDPRRVPEQGEDPDNIINRRVQGFAVGGWVNSEQLIRAGEAGRELILPNPVSEFLARTGLPVNVRGPVQSNEELGRIADLLETGNRDRLAATERLEEAQIRVATSMEEVAREARSIAGILR